jgi:E3 ubiquitin-protein ligase UBR1
MLGMIELPAGFSLLAARKRWAANGKNKTLLEVLWMPGEHEKYVKLFKARVDWILERMIVGGDGCVREEVKRLRGWIDGSD